MVDATDLTSTANMMGNTQSLQLIADTLGISLQTLLILSGILLFWALIWKGFALWKSVKNTKMVWFIAFLISQTYGILEIPYMFIFSKIKDEKKFKQVHDGLLIVSIIFVLLSFWKLGFIIVSGILLSWFVVSILQKSLDNKDKLWMFLGIIALIIGVYVISASFSANYLTEVESLKLSMSLLLGVLLTFIVPAIYYLFKVRSSKSKKSKK